ncbi:class I SAM-dependent methyltransferase [Actinocorallia sp. API 0066]|uniref:class I SAM-dependent methyltransferase n=1 Tax=Actinocorallia sp. API 0066 TaxID=2896846 RepID=UPI001E507AE3|nr:class I SAM-dependent methyltransferase [Actinocorallia sp. API 0066]MCD0449278.1 class I SAM-dependent methyltransferase [Actinocorallia sp. API 0066]
MTVGSLQGFYEEPDATVVSGPERADRQLAMVRDLLDGPPLRVLDVGCGDGAATGALIARHPGHSVVGTDWSMMALRRARERGVPVVRAGTDALPVADGSVDVVFMSELIEHLVDTDAALEEIHRALKPGGTLLISTPNLAAWFNRALLAVGVQPVFSEVSLRAIHGRPGEEVVGHLRMFTLRALTGLLEANGFRCDRIAGAPYHDVPRPLRPLDRLICRRPSLASILLVRAVRL